MNRRESQPITLHDGRVVDSWSEDWRRECEARFVLAFPSLQERRDYLSRVSRRRGMAHADRLRDTMRAIWNLSHLNTG